ncbi:hypothetical protein OKW37_001712 [Paraburkholderia sp. MM5482-R2]
MQSSKVEVILLTDCDRRTYDYLVSECGFTRVSKAIEQLPGRRRPYVSNIAKILGVTIPESVVITPREAGREHLARLKKLLSVPTDHGR